jgi:MFS family permease
MSGGPTRDVTPTPAWLQATLVLLALSFFINYVDRGNLSTAAPLLKEELGLSATELGSLLTAFFLGYMPMQIVAGWLADRFGAGRVLVGGFIVWSIATALTGLAYGFSAIVALRLLLGMGESVSFPAASSMIARCFPESKRGLANAAITAGMASGPAFGIFFGGLMIAAYGWRPFFVVFGFVSLLWLVPWLLIAQPRLSERGNITAAESPATQLILRERSLWGASLGHFCGNYVWYFVLTWIPYYLVHERHWSIVQMSKIGGAAYLLMAFAAMATGWYADRRIAAGSSPTIVRKTSIGIGAAITAVCMLGCGIADNEVSAALLLLACFGFGFVSPNIFAVGQSIAGPGAAGKWIGVQNCLANIAGIIAPFLTGVLVDRTGNFLVPFYIAAAISLLGGLFWIFGVGSIAPIDWSSRAQATRPRAVQVASV